MINTSDFKKSISAKIENGRLLEAIESIRGRLLSLRDSGAIDLLNRIASTYSFLLRFLREGNPDPHRDIQLNEVREDLLDLTEFIDRKEMGKDSPELFHTQSRLTEFSDLNFSEALGRFLSADAARQLSAPDSDEYKKSLTAQNMALKDIFSIVWTMLPGKSSDLTSIINVAIDPDISFSLRGVLVGALIMNLLHAYDRHKFNALLSIESKTQSEKIRARALTGIALILDTYPQRIGRDEALRRRFESLSDDLTFYTRMREVIYSLAKARGAVNYLRKMQTDLFPDIRKFGPDFLKNIKNDEGEIDLEKLEENPEWSKMMEKTGIEKKLRRLTNMQSSGADMMLTMFEQASRNFFFNEIDSWFRPFAEWETERLGMSADLRPILEVFSLNPGICDSDKFSMVINLQRMPESARALLRSTFEAQMAELSEEAKSMMLHTSTPEFDVECYNYARTLFRFFNFFRSKQEFDNPFERAQRFSQWPFIGNILAEKEIMSAVGEYYYRQGFFHDAIAVYRQLEDYDASDEWKAFCLQKIGCAQEKTGRVCEALDTFIEAFKLAPEDEWIAKKIAKLSSATSTNSEDVRRALLLLFFKDRDNLDYLLPLAEAESKGWIYEDPSGKRIKFLDRAAYLASDNHEVIRLLATRRAGMNNDLTAVKEGLEILRPLIDNAEMYLASVSLSESTGSEIPEPLETDSEQDIVEDLILALYLFYLNGQEGECVAMLKNLRHIRKEKFSLSEVETCLRRKFPSDATLMNLIEALPLYNDAIAEK
ncbi:MAG: hypothetical protein K2M31_05250 [Muribaculaceae bacterium]|nr:hypothetical protein [Muribaculaceae bacterium]